MARHQGGKTAASRAATLPSPCKLLIENRSFSFNSLCLGTLLFFQVLYSRAICPLGIHDSGSQ